MFPSPHLRMRIWSCETGLHQVHDITSGTSVSFCCILYDTREMFYSALTGTFGNYSSSSSTLFILLQIEYAERH